jgi:hypothetical protein
MTNKILPRNLTARADYDVPGNPPTTRPESGVGNCYPGLEYDHRNLDRRFFPGLVVEYVAQSDTASLPGARVVEVDTSDPELTTAELRYLQLAGALREQLSGEQGTRLSAAGSRWFLSAIAQAGKKIELVDDAGDPLDGMVVWRLVRSLRPEAVTLTLSSRPESGSPGEPVILEGWRRRFTDPETGLIGLSYQPGELTQSLCSPWMHDFRDCACTYWASNHPDIVFPEILPGEATLPSGKADDPLLGEQRIDWLRERRARALTAWSGRTQGADLPYQVSHFEINETWQDLAVVLEDRETSGPYVPRSRQADNARPYATPVELRDQLLVLAGLEHLVILLYLYARYSLLAPDEVKKGSTTKGRWPTLADDVEFVRHQILGVAISEMQHMRWANHLLWGLADAKLIPGWTFEPAVVPPALKIPAAGKLKTDLNAELRPLDPQTRQLFEDIEEPSGYIDGRYARATATLLQSAYPSNLYQMASSIVRDGEQHFLCFRDINLVLSAYGQDLPYLRQVKPGDPKDPSVKAALAIYSQILDDLVEGYQLAGPYVNRLSLAEARKLMFDLDREAEALARKGIGLPYLSLFPPPAAPVAAAR